MKILFVCTGNTCRSPMACALMNKLASDNDMDIKCDSAGIFANSGDKASTNAIKAMLEYEIDLSNHSAKALTEDLIKEYDLILTMTQGHKTMISALAPEKVYTICEYAGYNGDIKDPFGSNLQAYKDASEDIYDCLTEIAEKIYDMTEETNEN